MRYIIDRRPNPKGKSLGNRQRFVERTKEHIRDAVRRTIQDKNIRDVASGDKIKIPSKGITEPTFRKSPDEGSRDVVVPGNEEYVVGDRLGKPPKGGGKGKKAGNSGEGEDEFSFELSKSEFLDIFFEDLELPDMIKQSLKQTVSWKYHRSGFTNVGNPSNLNILRTMREAQGRRIALRRPSNKQQKEIELQIFELESKLDKNENDHKLLAFLHEELAALTKRKDAIPFIDPLDVRYNNFVKHPKPTTQAVMFCVMDTSGSMGEREKDIAKRFFMLLYLFLEKQYEKIDIRFIRHTHEASEVDEDTFFYSRETGGTIVSAGLTCLRDIIKKDYPTQDWNIYVAQASDGDNWHNDSAICQTILTEDILPITQYYSYIEIAEEDEVRMLSDSHGGELWQAYRDIASTWKSLQMRRIGTLADILPVFMELFKKSSRR